MDKIKSLLVVCMIALLGGSFAGTVQAQACYPGGGALNNEIGIRFGSLTNASNAGGINNPDRTASIGFLNGVHYKRYSSFGAFRLSLGFDRFDHEERNGCPECMRTDAKITGVKIRAGYEWFAILGNLEPYVGIDAVAGFEKYDGETYSLNSPIYRETTDQRNRRGLGLAPVAGLRLWLGGVLSISAETTVEAMFWGRSTTVSQISPETSVISRSSNYFETTFHPVNWLSLNIMF
ncbi:MAG: hypothetical protein AAF570_05170 [Bacteroidota bacterium]